MNLPFIHQHCLNPVKCQSPNGSFVYYPCGSCSACQHSKQSQWQRRLELQLNDPNWIGVFITLTYDNANLPLCYYDSDGNVDYIEVTRTRLLPPHTKNFNPLTDRYDSVTQRYFRSERVQLSDSDYTDIDFSDFYLPHYVLHRSGNNYIYDKTNSFAFAYLPDIQNFIKRLRFSISCCPSLALEDNTLSYFICSEYGPGTFRPHFHGLLFFRSSKTASQCVNTLISTCWQKQDNSINAQSGSPIASFVLQGSSASSYVSDYCTLPSDLLPVFKLPCFKPFHTQSKNITIGSEAFTIDDVPRMLFEDNLLYNKSFFDTKTNEFVELQLSYPHQCWDRVFPKFLFGRLLDVSTQHLIFRRLLEVSKYDSIPDYRSIVKRKFGVGQLYSLYNCEYVSKTCYRYEDIVCPDVFPDKYDSSSFRSDENVLEFKDGTFCRIIPYSFRKLVSATSGSSHSHYITPGDVVTSLEWIKSYLDYYLFGFNQNLTASRKIIDCMRRYNWCSDAFYYSSLYSLFFTKQFTLSLGSYYDGCLSKSSVQPFDLYNIYYSYFSSLPRELSAFSEDKYNFFDSFISNYGFNYTDFYDSAGKMYNFSFLASAIGQFHLRCLSDRKTKIKNVTIYKHDLYNCK